MKSNLLFRKQVKITISVGLILVSVVASLFVLQHRQNALALTTSDFVPGRIIDDTIFYNKDSMSAQQIQEFLNKLIPYCDTFGNSPVSSTNPTLRKDYAAQKGWPGPPYSCLNNYYENPSTGETSFERGGGAFPGGIPAAQIIYDAAQKYGINPQVLLVLLKKESAGPLTADSWPLKSQYKYAMGYACPDSGPNNSANCNSKQAGFYKQVDLAAWQLKYYKDNANSYRYKIGWNDIQYSPDASCGTKRVYIENLATLSLYIYTPYTPNDGALASYPGEAACGAYGNRNFFMFFKEWFGSPSYRPPSCDSRVSGVTCVWRLYDPANNLSEFLTTSNEERDSAVRNSQYSYEDIAFYAYTSPRQGTVPVYRIRMPTQHFYTSSEQEKDTLIQNSQNRLEGIAFYVYPSSTSTSSSYSTYRLYSSRSGHTLTSTAAERDELISKGYSYESIPFNTPSGISPTQSPTPGRINVYRLSNSKNHVYTADLSERDKLIRSNWSYEGILQQAPSSPTAKPVYRLFNNTHLFTSSDAERISLMGQGWRYEGIGWYIDDATPPTYRLYVNNHHLLTTSFDEALSISNQSGTFESVAFGQNQSTNLPVYRLFNGTSHFYSANVNEVLSIANTSWRYEGVGWTSSASGTPVFRLKGAYHFYTASTSERDALARSGWRVEGIAWYTNPEASTVFRLKGAYHFYTASTSERDALARSGWRVEGIAW